MSIIEVAVFIVGVVIVAALAYFVGTTRRNGSTSVAPPAESSASPNRAAADAAHLGAIRKSAGMPGRQTVNTSYLLVEPVGEQGVYIETGEPGGLPEVYDSTAGALAIAVAAPLETTEIVEVEVEPSVATKTETLPTKDCVIGERSPEVAAVVAGAAEEKPAEAEADEV